MTQKEYASKLISAFYAEFGMERNAIMSTPKLLILPIICMLACFV